MKTKDFARALVEKLEKYATKSMIELAEKSISEGITEYLTLGYISLKLGQFNLTPDNKTRMLEEYARLGLRYKDYRTVMDTAEIKMRRHLEGQGWKVQLITLKWNDEGGTYEYRVKLPERSIAE